MAESAPPDRTGFALGLAMSVNQAAIVLVPPALGLLKDATGSFTPAWGLLSAMTAVALAVSVRAGRRRGSGPARAGPSRPPDRERPESPDARPPMRPAASRARRLIAARWGQRATVPGT
ncbi:hypothetical protein ACFU8Q_41160, partial [Streptomyces sp. NPDC057543]